MVILFSTEKKNTFLPGDENTRPAGSLQRIYATRCRSGGIPKDTGDA